MAEYSFAKTVTIIAYIGELSQNDMVLEHHSQEELIISENIQFQETGGSEPSVMPLPTRISREGTGG